VVVFYLAGLEMKTPLFTTVVHKVQKKLYTQNPSISQDFLKIERIIAVTEANKDVYLKEITEILQTDCCREFANAF
jgi:hypothetical protein